MSKAALCCCHLEALTSPSVRIAALDPAFWQYNMQAVYTTCILYLPDVGGLSRSWLLALMFACWWVEFTRAVIHVLSVLQAEVAEWTGL